jgi:predicted transcriptional regulator
MTLETIAERLSLKCKCCWEHLGKEVSGGYAGDLLSDVMANSAAGNIWVTRQVHQNIVAVAALKEHAAVIIVQGATPEKETLEKAAREGIPILVSDLAEFELVGRLHRLLYPEQA